MILTRFDKDTQVQHLAGGLNGNSDIVEAHFAALNPHPQGRLVVDVSGDQDVILTAEEARNAQLVFEGTLTGNISVVVPNNNMVYHVQNLTTGNYTLTLKTGAGSGVVIQQASFPDHPRIKRVLCDGSDIVWADGSQIVQDNLHEAAPANGYYIRYSDGTQICWHEVNLTHASANSLNNVWVFPQPFLSGTEPDVQLTLISHLLRGSIASGGALSFHSLFIRQISNTQVQPQAQSTSGYSWAETDNLYVKCRAIGRW